MENRSCKATVSVGATEIYFILARNIKDNFPGRISIYQYQLIAFAFNILSETIIVLVR